MNFLQSSLAKSGSRLAMLLQPPLPPDLQAEPIGIPSAFRRLDLTHFDVLALGQNFVTRFPDRFQPILLLGLRTAGSYLLRCCEPSSRRKPIGRFPR